VRKCPRGPCADASTEQRNTPPNGRMNIKLVPACGPTRAVGGWDPSRPPQGLKPKFILRFFRHDLSRALIQSISDVLGLSSCPSKPIFVKGKQGTL
jgi:hypothetical protein